MTCVIYDNGKVRGEEGESEGRGREKSGRERERKKRYSEGRRDGEREEKGESCFVTMHYPSHSPCSLVSTLSTRGLTHQSLVTYWSTAATLSTAAATSPMEAARERSKDLYPNQRGSSGTSLNQ